MHDPVGPAVKVEGAIELTVNILLILLVKVQDSCESFLWCVNHI